MSQVLREEARVAQAAEVEELSAERDALLEKSKAQHAQCLQHLAESQALRQELAAAYEGMTAASVDMKFEHLNQLIVHPVVARCSEQASVVKSGNFHDNQHTISAFVAFVCSHGRGFRRTSHHVPAHDVIILGVSSKEEVCRQAPGGDAAQRGRGSA